VDEERIAGRDRKDGKGEKDEKAIGFALYGFSGLFSLFGLLELLSRTAKYDKLYVTHIPIYPPFLWFSSSMRRGSTFPL
jgi:hypothetical protein